MKKIFISSVILNFEPFRLAAKSAVELMDFKPIMAENFSSRTYSSETACITEVQKSDLIILILGLKYGFKTPEGISVTQSEFRMALKAKKPILVFLQKGEMEPDQVVFKNEVEKFESGFFRTMFSRPEDLKDLIVKAIRNWEIEQQANDKERFLDRVKLLLPNNTNSRNEAKAIVVFWGQPVQDLDLDEIEANKDTLFVDLCKTGAASLQDGYELISRSDLVIFKSGKTELTYYRDGLILLNFIPEYDKLKYSFAYLYVSPQKVQSVATRARILNQSKIVWALVGLFGMENQYFGEPPEGNSTSIPMYNKGSEYFVKFFSPITEGVYEEWIEAQVKKFKRTYSDIGPYQKKIT